MDKSTTKMSVYKCLEKSGQCRCTPQFRAHRRSQTTLEGHNT